MLCTNYPIGKKSFQMGQEYVQNCILENLIISNMMEWMAQKLRTSGTKHLVRGQIYQKAEKKKTKNNNTWLARTSSNILVETPNVFLWSCVFINFAKSMSFQLQLIMSASISILPPLCYTSLMERSIGDTPFAFTVLPSFSLKSP